MSICKNCKEQNRINPHMGQVVRCTVNKMGLHYVYNDKPSMVFDDGSVYWFKNDQLHRKGDKPAWISRRHDGSWWGDFYYINGKEHRDGNKPAYILANGAKKWAVHGEIYKEIPHTKGYYADD